MKNLVAALCLTLLACGRGGHDKDEGAPGADPITVPTPAPTPAPAPQPKPKTQPSSDQSLVTCIEPYLENPSDRAKENITIGVKLKALCKGSAENLQTILEQRI